jgi:hypothetical protein
LKVISSDRIGQDLCYWRQFWNQGKILNFCHSWPAICKHYLVIGGANIPEMNLNPSAFCVLNQFNILQSCLRPVSGSIGSIFRGLGLSLQPSRGALL